MVIQRAGRSLFGIVDGLRPRKLSRGYFEIRKPPSLSAKRLECVPLGLATIRTRGRRRSRIACW